MTPKDEPKAITNEAAERLREWISEMYVRERDAIPSKRLLDAALSAERRATVERIRERFNDLADLGFTAGGLKMGMRDILDEEAAR